MKNAVTAVIIVLTTLVLLTAATPWIMLGGRWVNEHPLAAFDRYTEWVLSH